MLISFYTSYCLTGPCFPLSIRTMGARWCGLTLSRAPLPLRPSTGSCATTLLESVGAALTQTPPTTMPCMTSRWRSTASCLSLAAKAWTGIPSARAPRPSSPTATMTRRPHSFAGGAGRWITETSSWPTKHTSCTTRRRPRGNSGSE